MHQKQGQSRAAIGFTVKSGWASAVLLRGSTTSVTVVDTRRVDLSDPAIPEARQPYHAGFGTARKEGPGLSGLIASIERFGSRSVNGLIKRYRAEGHALQGVAVVAGSLIDPGQIANAHIRIHALEGRLFRRIVEAAAARQRLPCSIWRERDLYGLAGEILRQSEQALRVSLAALGESVTGSWRAEQKAAALAAWLVVAQGAPKMRSMVNGR